MKLRHLYRLLCAEPAGRRHRHYRCTGKSACSDGGRSMSKAEKQVAELREKQKQAKSSKEKNEIQKKINNIINTALKNKKGENHSQRAKR